MTRRIFGISFGIATHILFFATVWRLLPFFAGDEGAIGPLWIDVLLATQFAVVHSLLLHPATRRRLEPWINGAFYGCFFCVATCVTLWIAFAFWQSSPVVVWQLTGGAATAVNLAYFGSWIALFYSLSLTGLGYQTGFTPWWSWLRGQKPPRRGFEPRGVYRWMRHPTYLCFLGLIWLHPVATLDRAVLLFVWTLYVFVGSALKDRRLAFYVGAPYLEYQSRVPGYPLMLLGPLARVPLQPEAALALSAAPRMSVG